ncbi:hypothetical protein AABC73_13500 [Pseudomonas sp. G.S.17]|uniref:hypothetical protein n=1 Tax=Pseudomonas sp. G.S.17 TaxID=3137451 RepID=UPI00311C9EF1
MRAFLLSVLILLPAFFSFAFAVDFYYTSSGATKYADATAACLGYIPDGYPGSSDYSITSIAAFVGTSQPTRASCSFSFLQKNGSKSNSSATIFRYGTSCPAGSALSPTTGQCLSTAKDGEKCADQTGSKGPGDPMIFDGKQGKCVLFSESSEEPTCKYMASQGGSGTAYQIAGTWDGGVPSAPPSFAQSGTSCEVSVVSSSDCVSDVKGNVLCNVIGKLTGNVNNQTNVIDAKDAACDGGVCTPVKEETSVTDKPCVYSGSGDSVSCTSETETQKDGKQSCGTVNGVRTCVFSQPSSNGIKIDTNVKTTTNTDGSKTSVKTDNATKTTCTGINKCSTTSSSTTTTTKTNGAGQTTSTDTKCTGTCGSSGTGIQPGSGSGSGNGSGDGEEDGSGDGAGLTDPENGSFDGQGDEWDQKIADSKTELKDSLAKLKEAFSPVGDITLGGGGQLYCPPAVTVLGHSIDFCLDKYAGSLSWIASAIFALCAMVSLMIVFA